MRQLRILIAGRSRKAVTAIQEMLEPLDPYSTELRVITNGHCDPLHGVTRQPDLLILQHTPAHEELRHMSSVASAERIPMIVFGPGDDTNAVRLAMRAGASDYLPEAVDKDELLGIVADIAGELMSHSSAEEGSLHVFVNGKGGAGGSFLATNVAHGLATENHDVTLVDMDLQFAGLCRYLDMEPEHGLFEALQSLEELDEVSARAYTCQHPSGLRLLSATSNRVCLNADVDPDRLISMLQVYQSIDDFVIVDLPRHIDLLSAAVLERADRIMVVMQQTLPQVHDTARFMQILRKEMGIDEARITIVVNRYDKNSPIELKDIEKALGATDLVIIPNQYKLTAESINNGMPISEIARRTSVAKCLRYLHSRIGGESEQEESLLQRALPAILRR